MFKIQLLSYFILTSTLIIGQSKSPTCYKRDRGNNFKSNTLSVSQIAETEKYDVTFYYLNLNMTNTSTELSGKVAMYATAIEPLDSALFELFSTFNITGITVNGQSVNYSRVNSAIKVPVNALSDEQFIIETTYDGTPPTAATNPLGGSGMSQDDSPTWGNDVVWSLSEPFSAYEWFPCKQSLTDKADSSYFYIIVPSNLKAGSNGVLNKLQILEMDSAGTSGKTDILLIII